MIRVALVKGRSRHRFAAIRPRPRGAGMGRSWPSNSAPDDTVLPYRSGSRDELDRVVAEASLRP